MILVTNFEKSPSAAPLNLRSWWPEAAWFGQFWKKSVMASLQGRHRYYVTKL